MSGRVVPIVLRAGTARDLHFVERLSGEAFSRFGPYESYLPELLREPDVRTVIAESGKTPIGYAMFTIEAGEADLVAIATVATWQRKGVGRRMLEHVESSARGAGARSIRLTVAEDNLVARRLFESTGYALVPGEPGVYPEGQPSLTMRKRFLDPFP